jgi:hypothetical protein
VLYSIVNYIHLYHELFFNLGREKEIPIHPIPLHLLKKETKRRKRRKRQKEEREGEERDKEKGRRRRGRRRRKRKGGEGEGEKKRRRRKEKNEKEREKKRREELFFENTLGKRVDEGSDALSVFLIALHLGPLIKYQKAKICDAFTCSRGMSLRSAVNSKNFPNKSALVG